MMFFPLPPSLADLPDGWGGCVGPENFKIQKLVRRTSPISTLRNLCRNTHFTNTLYFLTLDTKEHRCHSFRPFTVEPLQKRELRISARSLLLA